MNRKRSLFAVVIVVVLLVASMKSASTPLHAQSETRAEDGLPPTSIVGVYHSSYYASFTDWEIFPVLLPMINARTTLPYEQRFDLHREGQITGRLRGQVQEGAFRIDLPQNPVNSAWFDTDGDPNTPSDVKLFVVGTSSGLIGTDYVTRYDFMYTRSFDFDPDSHLWDGSVVVWASEDGARFPILNGADNTYYTADDVIVTIPAGWSVIEVKSKPQVGSESVRIVQTSQPLIELREPTHLQDVDLSQLDYQSAFEILIDDLERTYIFTDYRHVNWEGLREKYAPEAAAVTNEFEFQQLLENALFTFHDGHLAIIGAGIPNWMWGRLGMRVYPVDDELMVVEVFDHSPVAELSDIQPGTVITGVNGEDAMIYFESVPRSVYSGGHESGDLWLRGGNAFRGAPGTMYELDYREPDGSSGHVTLATRSINEVTNDPDSTLRVPLYYDILESGVGIITIRNFTSARVDDLWNNAMQAMVENNVSGIIIDLRNNGGGFSVISNYMLGDFLDEDQYSGREISAVDKDGDGVPDVRDEFYYGRHRVYDPARVVVLVGPDCFSACEFAARGFQDIGATVMGYLPTGGAGGGVGASYYLPGNTRVYGMAVVRSEDPDGNIMIEGTGVRLDIQIPFTAAGLASGEDVVLHAAEDFLTR